MSHDPVVEAVARALCGVDRVDAESLVSTGRMVPGRSSQNTFSIGPEEVPAWTRRMDEASRFVAAFRALQEASASADQQEA